MNAALTAVLALALTAGALAQTYTTDFSTGSDGWSAGFADYPVGEESFYELESGRAPLPSPLNTNLYGFRISGNNHSDDLWMYITKKITGLKPNTVYEIRFDVEFATQYATNGVGVGGAPGTSVYMKAGAVQSKAGRTIDGINWYRMDIDKGQQAMPGADVDTIGHIGAGDDVWVWTLVSRTNAGHLFTASTDANGELWAMIGTDSGFEATTTLYYNEITMIFSEVIVPVELVSLSAHNTDEGVLLTWRTATEMNNLGFAVERKELGTWEEIGFVPGSGSSTHPNEYSFLDTGQPSSPDAIRYRLRQMDFDGSYEYSPVVEVFLEGTTLLPRLVSIYPQPASGQAQVVLELPQPGTVMLTLHNTLGERVRTVGSAGALGQGRHTFRMDLEGLPQGMYYLRMQSVNTTSVKSVLVR